MTSGREERAMEVTAGGPPPGGPRPPHGPRSPHTTHLEDQMLRAYAYGELLPPRLAHADAHVADCPHCRSRLGDLGDRARTDTGWARLRAVMDVPQPGPVERALLRCGVPDHTARLIAATPALRRSWLIGATVTLLLTVAVARWGRADAAPLPFFVLAPALPVIGVAASFGPRSDPMYEMTLVAPVHGLRLLLVRTVAVVGTTAALVGAAAVAMPGPALRALGWLLPSLALTLITLALSARLDPAVAAGVTGGGWTLALVLTFGDGDSPLLSGTGQCAAAGAALAAGAVIALTRSSFDRGLPHA
ncbi:zf-HC2 domain-containing protein [Streptomyces piniterrae]|nr:zf-HC2 domain-containing protein [Streptomyces piniterrae]